jgi:Xaa-Pro aminopeptidase
MRYESIGAELFVNNRKRLVKSMKKGGLALINSNDIMPTNADGVMAFRQNTDLFYLTGIEQEESILMICPDFPEKEKREILFLRQPNEHLEKWEGHKLSKEEATAISGVKRVMWLSEFKMQFHHAMVMGGTERVYLNTNEHYRTNEVVQSRDARFIDWCQQKYPLHRYDRLAQLISPLRREKQKREIELMQRACDITEMGFRRVLAFVRPGVMENEIEAEFIHEFLIGGSKGFAYNPIIASGKNNVVLHYIDNDQQCKDGELLLLDVAASYANYNSDLTRTIPVNGRFTKRQKEVYNSVLYVMRQAMKLMGPNKVYFDYQKEIEKIMEGELLKLKLITKKEIKDQTKDNPALKKYFYHGTSHMLGLDVHDVGNMHDKMKVGSVWTVEPGIYIKEEGFGVRLENNVVIQKKGVFDLMRNIPIEADEIEDLMNKK